MPANDDLLFGRVAVSLGFCTQDQVDRVLGVQEAARERLPVGRHMVEEGVLSEEQHSKVLEVQRRNMLKLDPVAKLRKEDVLLGKLAVREGYVTGADLNECLRLQGARGERRSLGEIMVAQGCLSSEQVNALLARQSKKIMSCPGCRLSFTVLTISRRKTVDCPRCRGPLEEGKASASVRTDGEFATGTARAIADEDEPPPAPAERSAPCKVCEHPFVGPPDATGRVTCLSCRVSFAP